MLVHVMRLSFLFPWTLAKYVYNALSSLVFGKLLFSWRS